MKKIIKIIELISIILISIIIYNKTSSIIKRSDTLMTEIKNKEREYYIKPENAIIKNETIKPGINGKKIDIEKTYIKMKKINTFSDKYIIYEEIYPKISLENNKNKYIIAGNNNKKEIGIIIETKKQTNIEKIIKIIDKNNIQITFQTDNTNDKIINLQKDKYEIENLNLKEAKKLCILDKPNQEILKLCSKQNKYTIIPNIVIKQSLLSIIKKEIKNGSIIKIYANKDTINELDIAIKYIKSKGLEIKKISELISEKNNN